MSLNDNVLDDLPKESLVDGDLVKLPSDADNGNKEPITIIPEGSQTPPADEITEEQTKELLNQDVTFEIVDGQQKKLVNLQQIEDQIVAQESISKHGAVTLNATFEGLFNDNLKPTHFTEQPTKTNYAAVKKHVRASIAKEELTFMSRFEEFVEKTLSTYRSYLLSIKDVNIPLLKDNESILSLHCSNLEDKLKTNKNLVLPVGTEFLNIFTTDIRAIDEDKIDVNIPNIGQFVGSFKALKATFESFCFLALINSVRHGISPAELIPNYENPNKILTTITMNDLCQFFANSTSRNLVEELDLQVTRVLENIEKFTNEASSKKGDAKAVQAYVAENSPQIQSMVSTMAAITNIMNRLPTVIVTTTNILDFCETL